MICILIMRLNRNNNITQFGSTKPEINYLFKSNKKCTKEISRIDFHVTLINHDNCFYVRQHIL